MADLYLHSRLIKHINKSFSLDLDLPIACAGAQGPDPLYYRIFPTLPSKQSMVLANQLHNEHIQAYLEEMISFLKEHRTHELESFVYGYICHYTLDVSIHPYIYNKVGVYKLSNPATHKYRGLHLKYERGVDCKLMLDDENRSSAWYPLTKELLPLKKMPVEVEKMLSHVGKNIYNTPELGRLYSEGYTFMYRIIKYLSQDKLGIKKQLFKILDMFRRTTEIKMQDVSFFNYLENGVDYLNEHHKEWHHPVTNEIRTDGVRSLYNQAYNHASDIIKSIKQYLDQGTPINYDQLNLNRSLDTGLDCDDTRPIQHFNIYKKVGK
jgi:hypothetical protein